jgi:hypothetical protein
MITQKFGGGPVGLDTLSTAIGEDRGTLEDMIEPYLIQQGFIMRTATINFFIIYSVSCEKKPPQNCKDGVNYTSVYRKVVPL